MATHTEPVAHFADPTTWSSAARSVRPRHPATLELTPFSPVTHAAPRPARRAIAVVACTPGGTVIARRTLRPRACVRPRTTVVRVR